MRRFLVSLLAALPSVAYALPPVQTGSASDDDAVVTLALNDRHLRNDARSYCSVTIDVNGNSVAWTQNDHVFVFVYEDDTAGDDLIWSTDFVISASELSSGRVRRSFDCSGNFDEDGVGGTEIYAHARVEKQACGSFCRYDRPETSNLLLGLVDDDAAEDDDASTRPADLTLGRVADRVARDADWLGFDLGMASDVELRLDYVTTVGRLELDVFDAAMNPIGATVERSDGVNRAAVAVPPQMIFVRVRPTSASDPNFYDLNLVLGSATCTPGNSESVPCGRCGMRTRTCAQDRTWGAYGACSAEGECAQGSVETRACQPMGIETRTCDATCHWGTFGGCMGECAGIETRGCYDGPSGTDGVGPCRAGTQTCATGNWGTCESQVLPAAEVCGNTIDDDCDSRTDGADSECGGGSALGSACTGPGQCAAGLTCITTAPFTGGFCGEVGCTAGMACQGDGRCVHLFGEDYCFARCTGPSDCRASYLCLEVSGESVCAPECKVDDECQDPAFPVCNPITSTCVPAAPDGGVLDSGVEVDAGTTFADTGIVGPHDTGVHPRPPADSGLLGEIKPVGDEDGGCACQGSGRRDGSIVGLAAMLSLLMLRRRRA